MLLRHVPFGEEYRRKAEVALAEAARDPSVKETYREVAELWYKLVREAKKDNYNH